MVLRRILSVVLIGLVSACSLRDAACGRPAPQAPAPQTAAPEALGGSAQPDTSTAVRIAFLGDSLTAGLGLLSDHAFPARIQALFEADDYEVEAINAGISGDTTAGGLRRVEQLLDGSVRVLVLALGANDALRGLSVQQTQENLTRIIDIALARGVAVLLCGMEGPANLGQDYRDAFRQAYVNVLRTYQGRIAFVPFLLEGVAGNPALNQQDGIHPTREGAEIIAKLLYPQLRNLVDRAGGG